jgi:hypothetical protein
MRALCFRGEMKKIALIYISTVLIGIVTAIFASNFVFNKAFKFYAQNEEVKLFVTNLGYQVSLDRAASNIENTLAGDQEKVYEENCETIEISIEMIERMLPHLESVSGEIESSLRKGKKLLNQMVEDGYCELYEKKT